MTSAMRSLGAGLVAMGLAATALAVGLKVDVDALPEAIVAALRAGQVDLTDPAVTIALLRVKNGPCAPLRLSSIES